MQQTGDKKIQTVPESGKESPKPLIARKTFDLFNFFSSPGTAVREKNGTAVLVIPPQKSASPATPRADLTAVRNWVSMEEKIVHDYKEQKKPLFKHAVLPVKTPAKQPLPRPASLHPQGKKTSAPPAAKKGFSFFNFLISPKTGSRGRSGAALPPNSASPATPRADLTAVRNWVGMEEKIVHDYKEKKAALPKRAVPLAKPPVKQAPPAFETFSTQTTVSLSPKVSKLKEPLRSSKSSFSGMREFLPALGWVAAGVLVFLYLQAAASTRETSERLQSERNQLQRSYAELKNAAANQSAEMKWLASQLRDSENDLRTLRENKAEFSRDLEKKYREELMRITVRYETELDTLRGTVQTQEAVAGALKAQIQALEKILDQIRMSAVSGGVAGFFRSPAQGTGISASEGQITTINGRQGFFVLNLGSEQGARSGQRVTVSRDGILLAAGRIDRVYPSMSVVTLRDKRMLNVIREGDTVSF